MSEKHLTSPIYSIAVGDPVTGFKWRVNQVVNLGAPGKGKIVSIQEDEVHQKLYNIRSYIIVVTPENEDYYDNFIWRRIENQPVELIYSALKRI